MIETDDTSRDGLVDFDAETPPDRIWRRLERTQARRAVYRKAVFSLGLAVIASASLPSLSPPRTLPQTSAGNAARMPVEDELRALDRSLQAAYARGADPAEIQQLWTMRRAIANAAQPAPDPMQI